ncbi:hypothetical protein [Pleomorphomonas sp. PLEO]|uniref:hypothetical protein n=1 Tax=Pleomorphomonas sp. PLEO TaxID=3239306 RepID=UPI00351DED0E
MAASWPILLTASAGILALLPISLEIFWGTMPFAVIGGLTAAIVLALLLLPAIPFLLTHRERRQAARLAMRSTPTRAGDDLRPALSRPEGMDHDE